jgi:hypothetical protein
MQAAAQTLPADRVAALAGTAGTVVYQYEYDTAPAVSMTAEEQALTLKVVCTEFDRECRLAPEASDECSRERILRTNATMCLFQQLYPRVFASVTVRARTTTAQASLEHARKSIMLMLAQKMVSESKGEDATPQVQHLAARLALRPTVSTDLQGTTIARLDDAAAASGVPLEPLDVRSFGGRVVFQDAEDALE